MTPDDISTQLALIREAALDGDYERAHVLQDELYRDYIRFVAEHGRGGWARMAYQVYIGCENISFPRHYA